MTDVVLISFDALRYDYVKDKKKHIAPFLYNRTSDGDQLNGHFSTGPGTSTSFPGIHASALPLDHGYTGLNENHTSLAEVLSDSGIQTLGVTAQTSCSSLFDYQRGFDVFEDWVESNGLDESAEDSSLDALKQGIRQGIEQIPGISDLASAAADRYRELNPPPCPYRQAPEVTDTALDLVAEYVNSADDFFVWIHYMEPHQPYHPPADCIERFHDGGFDIGKMYRTIRKVKRVRPDIVRGTMGEALSAEERDAIRDYYAAATNFVDREAKRLVEELDSKGYLNDTIVMFTADHGEELFDHGDFGHPPKLYDELIHVPLIVDDRSGRVQHSAEESALTSHLDLAPTIVDLLDVDAPSAWRGESFTDLLTGATTTHREYVIAELCHTSGLGGSIHPEQLVAAVRTDEYKFIRNRQLESESLYHLPEDPSEQQNVISERPDVAESFRDILESRLEGVRAETKSKGITNAAKQQLKALGYRE